MFTVTHKKGPHGLIIVVTDTEILGKYFHEGNRQLDLRSQFYQGEDMDEEKTKVIMHSGSIIHFTGKRSVALGISLDLIEEKNVLVVQDVPHAEVVLE